MYDVLVNLLMAFHISSLFLVIEETKATKIESLVSSTALSIRGEIPRHTEEEIFRSQFKRPSKAKLKKMLTLS